MMLVSVVDGSRPLARIAGAFRGGGSVSVHVGPPGALAHIAERRRGTIAGACRGERPVWPVPTSWAEASVSLSSQPGGCCRCDSGFGCEQLDRQLARIVERRQCQCACTKPRTLAHIAEQRQYRCTAPWGGGCRVAGHSAGGLLLFCFALWLWTAHTGACPGHRRCGRCLALWRRR